MISIKELQKKDFDRFKELYEIDKEWRKWDGPYFKKITKKELKIEIAQLEKEIFERGQSIENEYIYFNEKIIGKVNWYYRSKETNWIEVGIRIMDEIYWNKSLGTNIMKIWITRIFEKFPEIIRLGFTTWSGNLGMMKIGEKLGMSKEATYKNARIVDDKYYDSVSFGVQRDEFFNT